jgi:hypothetical protein
MEQHKLIYTAIRIFTVAVWFVNGLYCKVLGQVPRHQLIVAKILGSEHAHSITFLIGIAELIMAAWIASGFYRKLTAVAQITIVVIMNTLEFFMARELLLWGSGNAFFAFIFICLIYFNEFKIKPATT